jgi:hypothetical protein
MFPFFSDARTKEKNATHCVWNIDSQSVSVMIIDHTKTVVFYRSYDHKFSLHDRRHVSVQLEDWIVKNITQICTDIHIRKMAMPVSADIVLGEPWSHGITRKIHHTRKTDIVVNKKMIRDLILRDIQTIDKKRYSYDSDIHTNFSKPHIHTVSFAGHIVTDWVNKKTNDVRVEYSIGFFDKKITDLITQKIHEQLKIKMLEIHFHNYQIVHYSHWEKTTHIPSLIIYPSGLLTSIFWVEKKSLKAFGTIPVGLTLLYQEMQKELSVSHQEINTLAMLYRQNTINASLAKKIDHAFYNSYQDWELVFQKFCSQLVHDGMRIEQVIWMTGGDQEIAHLLMNTVHKDHASFPVIFGAQKVNAVQGSPLFISSPTMKDTDRIILSWLNNK